MKLYIEKSTTINAPITTIRPLIEDFNQWNSWSPWTVLEPSCSVNIAGKPNEPGHSMTWDGEIIGSGKNTLESANPRQIHYDLQFFKPWKSQAKVSFTLAEENNQTKVTWTMLSSMPFFLFFMVKTTKNLVGMDYERGLIMLKAMAELGRVNATTTNEGLMNYEGFSYVGIQRTVAFSEMSAAMEKDFATLVDDIVVKAKKGAKHWVCIYPKFDIKTMVVTYIAAVSDEDVADVDLGSTYVTGHIADAKALEIKHNGAYDFLGNAWSMGMMFLRAKKYKGCGHPFEQYWNSPMEVSPDTLQSSVYFPVK